MLVVIFRAVVLYVLIMFCIRLMGKRQLGELQPSELVITILISNIASLPIEDTSIPVLLGAIPVLILVGFEIIISNISLQSKSFRQFISGRPVVIINNGTIDQKQLRRIRFSVDDLMESLRLQNIFDVKEVEYAIVETTGKVSVLSKFDYRNVTPKDLSLKGEDGPPPAVIISDGKIVLSALEAYSISEIWVYEILNKNKQDIKNVFLMTTDKKLNYYIVPKQIGG